MLKSPILQNKTVATMYGNADFNQMGESTSLTEEQQKALAEKVAYLKYVPEKEEKVVEEVKEEKPKAKKTTAKSKKPKEDKE